MKCAISVSLLLLVLSTPNVSKADVILAGTDQQALSHYCGDFPPDPSTIVAMQINSPKAIPTLYRIRGVVWLVPALKVGTRFRVAWYCLGVGGKPQWSEWYYVGPATDLTGDGEMTHHDKRKLDHAMGSKLGDEHYIPHADVDLDGAVGFPDANAFRLVEGLRITGIPALLEGWSRIRSADRIFQLQVWEE